MKKALLIIFKQVVLFSVISLLTVSFGAIGARAFADSFSCTSYTLPVNLSATDPTVYHVFGELCSQGPLQGKTVQFVIHGISYDHNYWEWPQDPQKYSYIRQATDAGYATFNIDRIGIGNSDHPLSSLVTLQSNAFVTHQLVQDLRSGIVGGTNFAKIILVGHSFGSNIAMWEQSNYADTDGLILSGSLHAVNPNFLAVLGTDLYPASQDPKFANSNFPGVYLTTIPGTRASLFYTLSDADPTVITLDEQLKQTATDGELATITDSIVPTVTLQIHVPVFLAVGQNDFLFCNSTLGLSCQDSQTVLARESSDYSSQACLEAFVLPNSGHDVNLHLNARDWFAAANNWANRRIGNAVAASPTQPCQ